MENSRQTKKLDEVCNIINGSTPLRSNKEFWNNGSIPWFTIDDIREQGRVIKYTKQKVTQKAFGKKSERILPEESVLLCCTASVGEYAITKIKLATNQQFNGLVTRDKKILDPMFLYYFSSTLKDQLLNLSGKTTIDFIPVNRLGKIEIPIPSIQEQKRTVKIIDETFKKLEKIKENTEKKLQNSKELFESYLNNIFSNPEKDWEEKTLKEILKLEYGKPLPDSKRKINGKYPIYGANGEKGATDEFYYNKLSIIVGRKGTAGALNLTKEKFWPLDVTYFVTFDNLKYNLIFIYYLLLTLNLTKLAKGVKPGINRNEVYSIVVNIPKSLQEQKQIVDNLNKLSEKTKKLEEIYKKKIENIEELKKSILHKAFNGEL